MVWGMGGSTLEPGLGQPSMGKICKGTGQQSCVGFIFMPQEQADNPPRPLSYLKSGGIQAYEAKPRDHSDAAASFSSYMVKPKPSIHDNAHVNRISMCGQICVCVTPQLLSLTAALQIPEGPDLLVITKLLQQCPGSTLEGAGILLVLADTPEFVAVGGCG